MNSRIPVSIIIIALFLIPAISIQAETIKKNFENEAEIRIGCVYGQVRYSPDGYYGDMPAAYTCVKIGNKHDISSIIYGSYRINGLALDQEYTITYSNSRFKTKTTNVTITKEHPCVEKYLFYYSDDERETIQKDSDNSKLVNKAKTTKISNENYIENQHAGNIEADEESSCTGLIHGSVGNSHGVWSWTPYPFALVTAGLKRARCNIAGDYSMSLLLYHEYYVTAHVIGFKPLTKYVYLTLDETIERITFDMDESEPVNSKSKTIVNLHFFDLFMGELAVFLNTHLDL